MKRTLAITLFIVALLFASGAQTQTTTSTNRFATETCVEACQKRNREEVKLCNTLYPPDSQSAKHRECLDKAKTKFDACIAACR
jgi:hypothetical protein